MLFRSHWGFQHYAESLGMRPLVGGQSRLQAGDWIVSPRDVHRQKAFGAEDSLELVATFGSTPGLWGLRTVPYFYSGDVPLHSADGDASVVILRCRRGFTPSLSAQGSQRLEL